MQTRRTMDYLPQLDALRALAIFGVMIQHWAEPLTRWLPWGELGVRCFFVLSGFLITGILLRSRAALEAGESSVGRQFWHFYVRRSLRILPIYFLTLGVGCWLGMETLQRTVAWHAGYVSNFYFAGRNAWHGYVSHLWSLSVEEQFYLFWPAVVLLLPRSGFPAAMAGGILLGPVSRMLCAATWGPHHLAVLVLTPCCLDSLLSGALLAWCAQRRGGVHELSARSLRRLGGAGCLATTVIVGLRFGEVAPAFVSLFGPLAEAALFTAVVAACARGVSGSMGRVLNSQCLQYTGRISYGLYLYHLFADYVGRMLAKKVGLAFPDGPGLLQFAVLFVMTYAAAMFSARFLEQPINDLKRFFTNAPDRRTQPDVLASGLASAHS